MLLILKITCVLLTSLSMSLSLAHALELPGKLRLDKEAYLTVQKIYYPGFTVGGFGEVLGLVAILALLWWTPTESAAFKWTLASFATLLATHITYWVLTHPVNNFWLKDSNLKGLSASFFGTSRDQHAAPKADEANVWKHFRNRWEFSHVVRAVLAMASLILLVVAIAR